MALGRALSSALTVLLLLSGCANVRAGSTQYRAGLVLHQNPDFSFQIPAGWRPAQASDWTSFGANQRPLQQLNDYGKAQFQRMCEAELARHPAVLISSRGSWIDVQFAVNQGNKYSSGYVLTEAEKQSLWQSVEKTLVGTASASDKPRLSLNFMEVVSFGPNTVLKLNFNREDRRGLTVWTVLGFYGLGM